MTESPKQTVNVAEGGTVGNITQTIKQYIFGDSKEQQAQRNRKAMLKIVKNIWVTGILEHSLHGAVLIELGLEEQREAVEHPWDMVLQMPDQPNCQLPPERLIKDVFEDTGHKLLILGEPGSGKTITLLELAKTLIAQADGDPTLPIPVVFNLSSWAEKQFSIAKWLVGELNSKYNIPKKIARLWVDGD
ncbi:MAG: hypothetical protein GY801_33860 [bacterium]|nr:hypothetical protein [bacterium]